MEPSTLILKSPSVLVVVILSLDALTVAPINGLHVSSTTRPLKVSASPMKGSVSPQMARKNLVLSIAVVSYCFRAVEEQIIGIGIAPY